MPDGYPDYPGHRQVLAYLRAYADRHGLRERAELGISVARVRPMGSSDRGAPDWEAELSTGEMRRYGGVIAATGLQWVPRLPEVAGRFEGEVLLSAAYRSARQAEGRRGRAGHAAPTARRVSGRSAVRDAPEIWRA